MKSIYLSVLLVILAISLKASVFIVTNNNNSGPGSLREAILSANANGSVTTDYIYFNIPASSVTNVIINLTEELPPLTSNTIIDATSQPTSFLGNTSIKIRLVRAASTFFNGLVIDGVSDVEIYGFYFSNFLSQAGVPSDERKAGIFLKNTLRIKIGAPNKQNGFGNNYTSIISPTSINYQKEVTISSNIIGLDPTGMASAPNSVGIDLSYLSNSTIGGPTEDYGNLVSSNTVAISLGGLSGNVMISFNVIGFDIAKTKTFPAVQSTGIFANGESVNLTISDNHIVSQFTGIRIDNIKNTYKINHNTIGAGLNSMNFGNTKYGIEVYNCGGGVIGGSNMADQNIIAYNEQAIQIDFSYPVSILKNSIYCNTKAGIEFKDLPPEKTITQSKIDFIGTNSASGTYLPNSVIELFADDDCPDCQGKTWLATVATNADGTWQYNGAVALGLTSTGTNADGATSGFSKPLISSVKPEILDTYCGNPKGSISKLSISDASVFEWYNTSNQLVGQNKDLTDVPAGSYYLKAGQPGGCQSISSVYTIKNTNISYNISKALITPTSCGQNNGSISIITYNTETPVEFTWTNANGEVISNNEMLINVPSGTYTLTGSNGNGCQNVAGTFSVGVAQLPVIDLTQMQTFISCDGKTVSVSNINIVGSTQPFNYQWKNENDDLVFDGLLLQGVAPGKYKLFVKDKYGCEVNSETIDFTKLRNDVLNVPNSISPNGDNINDTWKILGVENYPNADFYVFNRNGDQLFYSKGYTKEFDGTFNGKPLSVGVYYYLIDLKTDCGKLSGSITIIK